ncbi:DNA polymerase III subunit delta [Companilactobacillus versmoldensis]|uniref:DNA polymerase III subunit delta n=1 Tax=Companilactobacillus versmoldensis DSM 14857 = KCTC 3814 TaxID=1423815 RepID=A0A0R1SMD4_9LACO|nr:DNA polymerase III subunit delta [Companilactobacillus versmoldensis]KRL67866.1 DNA polymerase III subunit delta [Companilactobacillus versmoldensis DSM 14857 = KCTC 3814]
MKLTELKQQLKKGQIEPVYYLTGQESAFISQIQTAFKHLLTPEEAEMNFSSFDLEDVPLADLVGEAISAPFFGERRLVFADNPYFMTAEKKRHTVDQDPDVLIKYIQHPAPSTVLVIFANYEKLDARKKINKQLKKNAVNVEAGKLDNHLLAKTLQSQLATENFKIEPQALDLLISKTKGSYSDALNQLNKLKLYALRTKTIDQAAVDQLVPQSLDDNVFDLMNQILQKNITQAEELYRQFLLQKIDPILLTAIFTSQLRSLIQTKILSQKGLSESTIAKQLRIHPYRVKMSLQQSRKLKISQLVNMFHQIVELDYQVKSGQGDKELLFDLFIAKFA